MKPTSCDQWRDQLLLLAYGELDAAQAEACREHLAACSACRTVFTDWTEVQELLDAAPQRAARVDLAALCLQMSARDRRARHAWRLSLSTLALAASLLVVASLALLRIEIEPGQMVVAWRSSPAPRERALDPAGQNGGAVGQQFVQERADRAASEQVVQTTPVVADALNRPAVAQSAGRRATALEDWGQLGSLYQQSETLRNNKFSTGPADDAPDVPTRPATYNELRRELMEERLPNPALRQIPPGA